MPGDDSAYIVCVADNPRIHYCGDNSLFDPQTLSCLNYEVTSQNFARFWFDPFFYSLSIWLPTLVLLSTPSSVPLANRLQSWPVYIFFTTYLNLFIQTVPLFLLNFPIEHLCVCSCFYSFDRDSSWAWQGMKISRKDFLYRVISDAVPPQKLPRTEKLILG